MTEFSVIGLDAYGGERKLTWRDGILKGDAGWVSAARQLVLAGARVSIAGLVYGAATLSKGEGPLALATCIATFEDPKTVTIIGDAFDQVPPEPDDFDGAY